MHLQLHNQLSFANYKPLIMSSLKILKHNGKVSYERCIQFERYLIWLCSKCFITSILKCKISGEITIHEFRPLIFFSLSSGCRG